MAGLLDDPRKLTMLMSGLGLLTSKTRNQADRWKEFGAQGLISEAQNRRKMEQDAPMNDLNMQYKQAQLAALQNPTPDQTSAMQNFQAAGVDLSTPEGQKMFQEYLMKPGVSIDMGAKLPAGYMWADPTDITKGVVPLKGSKTEKEINQYTGPQSQAASFANRMVQSETNLENLTAKGYDPSNLGDALSTKGGMLGNYMKTPEGRQYRQAQEDWVRAKLRKESGAVIGKEEMDSEIQQYFPQPGDDPATMAQKTLSRKLATNNLIDESQGAFKGAPYDLKKDTPVDAEYEALKKAYGL